MIFPLGRELIVIKPQAYIGSNVVDYAFELIDRNFLRYMGDPQEFY